MTHRGTGPTGTDRKEEMDRRQCKNTINNIKNNMAAPETSVSTPASPEHPNTDEEGENNLKK